MPSCHHYDIIPSSTEPTCYCLHGFVYFEFQDTKTSRLDLWSLRCQWFVCVMVLVHSFFSYWQFLGIVIISLGHYDFPCFLVQIGITFTGEIVFAGELLRSTSYDARTFCDEGHFHPQYDWEYNIGDCHYACVENFFTPCAKVGGRVLSCREKLWNKRVQLVRARVEHLNTVLKQHSMFGGEPYRGWARNLAVFVKISLHASAVEVRMRGNIDGPRHDGYGPHKHNQAQI